MPTMSTLAHSAPNHRRIYIGLLSNDDEMPLKPGLLLENQSSASYEKYATSFSDYGGANQGIKQLDLLVVKRSKSRCNNTGFSIKLRDHK